MTTPQYPNTHGQPTPAPAKKRKKWPFIVGGLVVVGIIGSCAAQAGPSTPTSTRTVAPVDIPLPTISQAPAPTIAAGPLTTVEDGTYEVGPDMEPGRYKTTGPEGSASYDMCYWARNKDDSGQSIIANDIVKGPGSVTVKAGEFLKLSGGCTWTKQ